MTEPEDLSISAHRSGGPLRGRHPQLAALALVLVTFVVFSPALSFGFFDDDPAVISFLGEDRSLADLFLGPGMSGRYRPLGLLPRLIVLRAVSGNPAPLLHMMNIGAHLLAVAAMFAFVRRITGQPAPALLAAAFLAFHFHAYTVGYAAVFGYPLMNAALILALVAYAFAFDEPGRSKRRFLSAMLLYAIAAFTHESAVPLVLLFPLVAWIRGSARPLEKPSLWVGWTVLAGIVALRAFLTWVSVSQFAGLGDLTWRVPDLPSSAYFAQALVFPLPPLLAPLTHTFGVSGTLLVAVSSVIWALLVLRLASHAKRARVVLLGLAWAILASLLPLLLLPDSYAIGTPWLAYLLAPPSALLWALGVTGLLHLGRLGGSVRRLLLRTSAAAVATALLLLNLVLLPRQLDLYRRATLLVRDVAQAAAEWNPDQSVLFVNLPQFLPQNGTPLPVGFAGASVFPTYLPIAQAVAPEFDTSPRISSVSAAGLLGGFFQTHGDAVSDLHLVARALFADEVYLGWLKPGTGFHLQPISQADGLSGAAAALRGEIVRLRALAAQRSPVYVASPYLAQPQLGTTQVEGRARYFDPSAGWVWPESSGLYVLLSHDWSPSVIRDSPWSMGSPRRLPLSSVLEDQGLQLYEWGPPELHSPPRAEFADGIRLLDWSVSQPTSSDEIRLWVIWQASRQVDRSWSVFVHLVPKDSATGEPGAQADGLPLEGTYPTNLWRPGELILDLRRLPVPSESLDSWEIRIGLYDPVSGMRLPLVKSLERVLWRQHAIVLDF